MERQTTTFVDAKSGFILDASGMDLDSDAINSLKTKLASAHEEMKKLEAGTIKNPDENRKVTHFSDRLTYCESEVYKSVEGFAAKVKDGDVVLAGGTVDFVIINGIGGSALGPQLLQFAVNGPYWNEMAKESRGNFPRMYFLDNTDTSGVNDAKKVCDLSRTIVVNISKSGGTQETANNMIALKQAFDAVGLKFNEHAVAVTMEGSKLDTIAKSENWLEVFPMAESIGGRTSETNIVGHVPAALAGIDFKSFIDGAKYMDELTRVEALEDNPAYLLAASWYIAGHGRGDRNMVIVPYSDRLVLFGKYLQQLVMESLGKELDLDGKTVHQGLTVYGNKGGTDAHAYIQQLNDGRDDFYVTFIEPLKDQEAIEISENFTMGDYLHAFKSGLIKALRGKQRKVIDIMVSEVSPATLGMLIALYERAVAVYAELIHINAFHQPGVQAYKLASGEVNELNLDLQEHLRNHCGNFTASEVAEALDKSEVLSDIEGLLLKFAANARVFSGKTLSTEYANNTWQYSLK